LLEEKIVIGEEIICLVNECAIVTIFISTNDGRLLLWLLYGILNEVFDVSLIINDVLMDTGLMY
jgi:hypothetical protein